MNKKTVYCVQCIADDVKKPRYSTSTVIIDNVEVPLCTKHKRQFEEGYA